MTRVFDFTVAGVIHIIAVVVHFMGITLFQPGSALYDIATDGTAVMNGTARADLWFEIITIYAPLLAVGSIWGWLLMREYRRQVTTAVTRRPG